MNSANSSPETFNVLIVGAGVAALEAALALRDLGGARIATGTAEYETLRGWMAAGMPVVLVDAGSTRLPCVVVDD